MKKCKLQTWKSSGKLEKVKAADKFSIVPRSLFAPYGRYHAALLVQECSYAHFGEAQERGGRGSMCKSMAEVQLLDKDLRLIFARYDFPTSLQFATRTRRQGSRHPVYYRIADSTHIGKVPLKKLA